MTTVLVTGSTGFIANHLASRLRKEAPDMLVGIDVRPTQGGLFDDSIRADLANRAETQRVVMTVRPDLIFHLAGTIQGPADLIQASNLETSRNLVDCVRDLAPSARIVLVGSAAEYGVVPLDQQPVRETFKGTPESAYGRAKAEVAALASRAASEGLHVTLARPFNLVGAGIPRTLMIGAVASRLRSALAGPAPRAIRVGNMSGVRDFVAVEDVVDGLICVSKRGRPGEAYNLCSGIGRSVAEVIQSLISLTRETIELTVDAGLIRPGEVDAVVGSWEKARTELGWAPVRLFEDSLRSTWDSTALEEAWIT